MPPKAERPQFGEEYGLNRAERKRLLEWSVHQAQQNQKMVEFMAGENQITKKTGLLYVPGFVLVQLKTNEILEISEAGFDHIHRQMAIEYQHLLPESRIIPDRVPGTRQLLAILQESASVEIEEYQGLATVKPRERPLEWRQAMADLNKLHESIAE